MKRRARHQGPREGNVCRSHGDGASLRKRKARCGLCGWDGFSFAEGTSHGDVSGQLYVQGFNARSMSARRRDVKPNGGSGVVGSSAGSYTMRISSSAERQYFGALSGREAAAARRAERLRIVAQYA